MKKRISQRRRDSFLLLECVIAVMMFSVAVIALGRCMTNCLSLQQDRLREERARLALENAMVELQASPAMPDETHRQKLEGYFSGLTVLEQRRTLNIKNEDGVNLSGLHEITLTAEWMEGRVKQTKSLSFYLLRGT